MAASFQSGGSPFRSMPAFLCAALRQKGGVSFVPKSPGPAVDLIFVFHVYNGIIFLYTKQEVLQMSTVKKRSIAFITVAALAFTLLLCGMGINKETASAATYVTAYLSLIHI